VPGKTFSGVRWKRVGESGAEAVPSLLLLTTSSFHTISDRPPVGAANYHPQGCDDSAEDEPHQPFALGRREVEAVLTCLGDEIECSHNALAYGSAPMTEIWFVRHGETTANAADLWQGSGDAALTSRGEGQAVALGARLNGHRFDLVVSSDQGRAVATATGAGFTPEIIPELREMDLGTWEGLTDLEVLERHPDQVAALIGGEDLPIGGGERPSEFWGRIDAAVDQLVSRLGSSGRVLIVAHGGSIGAFLSGVLDLRARRPPQPLEAVRNASITVVAVDGGDRRLRVLNDAVHDQVVPEVKDGDTVVALVRHAESAANLAERWQGISDGPLSPRGKQQGAGLASWYGRADHVYTSHLERARHTAEAFADSHGLAVTVRPDLHEMAFGEWENLSPAEVRAKFPEEWEQVYDLGQDLRRGGTGESLAGASARLGTALEEIAASHRGDRVAVFTHGGVIRGFVGSVLGLAHPMRDRLEMPGNTSVTHVRVGHGLVTLVDYNLGVI
jgi:broad specificity phosphatase PhoE